MSRILSTLLVVLVAMVPATFAKEKYSRPAPIRLTHSGEKWADKPLRKLTVEEKIGQTLMVGCPGRRLNVESPECLQFREPIGKYHVGSFAMTVHVDGLILLRSELYEA